MPTLPEKQGPFDLVFIASRGTRVWPKSTGSASNIEWPQCRYFCASEVTDAQVEQLVAALTEQGHQWTKCQKLFKIDGVDAFSQPY